jgi:hypothetical protein
MHLDLGEVSTDLGPYDGGCIVAWDGHSPVEGPRPAEPYIETRTRCGNIWCSMNFQTYAPEVIDPEV